MCEQQTSNVGQWLPLKRAVRKGKWKKMPPRGSSTNMSNALIKLGDCAQYLYSFNFRCVNIYISFKNRRDRRR